MVTTEELKGIYTAWLQGSTLRQLGKAYGVRHGTIHMWLKKAYGETACNPTAQSLVRSILEDNPDDPEVLAWALSVVDKGTTEQLYHRSKHSIAMLSRYQTLQDDQLMNSIAVQEDTEVEPEALKLPLFAWYTSAVHTILWCHLGLYLLDNTEFDW